MRVRIKTVPDSAPFADGEWSEIDCDDVLTDNLKATRSWFRVDSLLKKFVREGRHLVQYEFVK